MRLDDREIIIVIVLWAVAIGAVIGTVVLWKLGYIQ